MVVTKDFVITDIPTGKIYPGAIIKPGIEGEVPSSDTFVWYTSDSSIASFDKNEIDGVVLTCHKPGTVYIGFTIVNSGIGAEIPLTIAAPEITGVTLLDDAGGNAIYEGETINFWVHLETDPANVDTSYLDFDWDFGTDFNYTKTEQNKCIAQALNASADQTNGTKITLTIAGKEYTFYRLVKKTTITIDNAPERELAIGEIYQLNFKTDGPAILENILVSNSSVFSVTSNGTITVKSSGTATINVYTKNTLTGEVHLSDSLTLKAIVPTIKITNAPTRELAVGEVWDLEYAITPNVKADLLLHSTNGNVAKLDSGKVYALSEGNATITLYAYLGAFEFSDSINITVAYPKISITNEPEVILQTGDIYQLSYEITGPIEFYDWEITSNIDEIVSMFGNSMVPNKSGTLSVRAIGENTLTGATVYSNSINITIYEFYIENTPKNEEIFLSGSWTFKITLNGTETEDVIWSTSDNSIIRVSSNGHIYGMSEGTATISARSKVHPHICDTIDITVTETYSYFIYRHDVDFTVSESKKMIANEFYNGNLKYVIDIPVHSAAEIANKWNSLGEDGKNVGYVVISVHGSPSSLDTDNKSETVALNLNDISSFEEKNIYGLLLIACNPGHIDYNLNVADAFARIVQYAPVMASDGTVYVYSSGRVNSKPDKTFITLSKNVLGDDYKRTDNIGWIVYRDESGIIENYYTNKKDTTVQELLHILYDYT